MCRGHYKQARRVVELHDLRAPARTARKRLAAPAGQQHCTDCDRFLKTSQFHRSGDGYHPACKDCVHNRQLKQKYGVGLDWKFAAFAEQGGMCAICRKPFADVRSASLDHCHETGEPRALLCDLCNSGLGYFRDNEDLLVAAAKYLLKHRLKVAA